MDVEKFQRRLDTIRAIKTQDMIAEDDNRGRISFSPQDEIALKHQILNPDPSLDIHTKNLRSGRLDAIQVQALNMAGFLVSFLESMNRENKMNNNPLIQEVEKDMNTKLNTSVSRDGWLMNSILNPVKKYSITGGEGTTSLFNRKPKEGEVGK